MTPTTDDLKQQRDGQLGWGKSPYNRKRSDELRDDGIAKVSQSTADWSGLAFAVLRDVAKQYRGQEFTVDRVHMEAERRGLSDPPHPNAWGAVIMKGYRQGIIINTNRVVRSERPDAHSRKITVMRGADD